MKVDEDDDCDAAVKTLAGFVQRAEVINLLKYLQMKDSVFKCSVDLIWNEE